MRISISYPPLTSEKGIPLLSQNRQFQWFRNPTYIYPVIPAYAATLLKRNGHEVIWDDGIAENLTYGEWLKRLEGNRPDLVAIESKTPVIRRHWEIIADLKREFSYNPLIALYGDHVTALPLESMESSPVDFVLTGGDYDFLLSELCDTIENRRSSGEYPKGIFLREGKTVINTGTPDLDHDLCELPHIDRELTAWKNYAYRNGNFKYTPGTYVMAGRDCWWGKCSFCSWTTLCPGKTYRTVSFESHVEEIGRLIRDCRVREIFDDSGCFPKGDWLYGFCRQLMNKGYEKKVSLGCNMRVGALREAEWRLMKRAGFRFILIGLESVNQKTLDHLNKGVRVEEIEKTITLCKRAGLSPHITTMVGYPWETKEDAEETIRFAQKMFTKGLVDTLQATIVVPYPGTPLFSEAKKNGWLLTENWDEYDMKQSVWKSPVSSDDVLKLTQNLYKAALNPRFILKKLVSIRSFNDCIFLGNAAMKVFYRLSDFRKKSIKTCN